MYTFNKVNNLNGQYTANIKRTFSQFRVQTGNHFHFTCQLMRRSENSYEYITAVEIKLLKNVLTYFFSHFYEYKYQG